MENATKALLIAAGVFLAIMLITLLVMGYSKVSEYYKQQNELLTEEQMDKFNKQFQGYNKRNIRGNEIISLMNKVIDYNTRQSYSDGTNYERIKVNITIGSSMVEQFKYDSSDTGIVKSVISNNGTVGSDYDKDNEFVEITNTPTNLINSAKSAGIQKLTDTKLQKLTAEIQYILADENNTTNYEIEKRRQRKIVLDNILKDEAPGVVATVAGGKDLYITNDSNKISFLKDAVCQYYQYTQFKRAKFECTEMKHDTDTGRVIEMNFKVQTTTQIINGVTVESVEFD